MLTHKITGIKINFDHSYVKLPHNAQQETKHRDINQGGFGIIYNQTDSPQSWEWSKSIMHGYFPTWAFSVKIIQMWN